MASLRTLSYSLQALETEVVEEEAEDMGNCSICVETFQVGDQVFFSLFSGITTLYLYYSQIQYPGCLGSRLHGCHPDCLQGWLLRFRMMFLDLLCHLRPPAIFLSLCALFYCSPLPGTPPALCADRGLATMEEVSRSKMVGRATMLATRNSLI